MTRRLLGKGPFCAQCRAGGNNGIDADWYVEGLAYTTGSGYGRRCFYRGYLCSEHKDLLDEEGASWRKTQRLTSAAPAPRMARS